MPSSEVMHKFKKGSLHSGSDKGPKVKDRKQAIAIMMSEKRKESKHGGKYPDPKKGKKKKKPTAKGKMSPNAKEMMLRQMQGM